MTTNDSPYGINVHVPETEILQACRELGVGWIRVDFNWDSIEPAKSAFNWADLDRVVAGAEERDLSIFATLAYSPGWANGGQPRSAPPSSTRDWTDFVAAAVKRYRGRVRHWGMWNEPNQRGFFTGTREQYIEDILAAGASTVRSVDSEARVLGPDLAHLRSARWDSWLRDILARGRQHLDIITHHIYKRSGGSTFRHLDGLACRRWWFWEECLRDVIGRGGASDKPVWITETGWDTGRVAESTQDRNYGAFLSGFGARPWLEKVFFYEIQDDPRPGGTRFGIVRPDLSRKPAFETYRAVIRDRPA